MSHPDRMIDPSYPERVDISAQVRRTEHGFDDNTLASGGKYR